MDGIQARLRLDRGGFALDVDLRLPGRGVTALFGPSGSGKTTLLRCIAGLERAPEGRVSVNGDSWQDRRRWTPPHLRPIGYVFQEACLFDHLDVLGNLRYGMKRTAGARREDLDQAIELLGIGALLERRVANLSGGERQRVGIARALATNPRLLLMDEPLAALDLKRKREILPFLEKLHHRLEIPVLYVTHSPDEVARLADHLVVMEDGRSIGDGPLAETLSRLDLPIRLGEDAGCILESTVGEVDRNWHLARVDFAGGSLWARDNGLEVGQKARVRILARDVSLAHQLGRNSIQNILSGTIDALGDDTHPAVLLARVRVGESMLLARLTRRAAADLGVEVGKDVYVQVKSVALLE